MDKKRDYFFLTLMELLLFAAFDRAGLCHPTKMMGSKRVLQKGKVAEALGKQHKALKVPKPINRINDLLVLEEKNSISFPLFLAALLAS